MMWAYFFTDIFAFLVCLAFYLPVLVKLMMIPKGFDEILTKNRRRRMSDPRDEKEVVSYTDSVE
jgi:hypothetical protein